MKKLVTTSIYSLLSTVCICASLSAQVKLTLKGGDHTVDVTVDGEAFTSYMWQTNQRKPVLYPLIAPDGTTVTRGYPFAPRPGERVDHPHHAGLWFNYGNVNGLDFWNNSDAINEADRPKYGTIVQDKIVSMRSGTSSGELVVDSTWFPGGDPAPIAPSRKPLLKQHTRYMFSKLTIDGKPARAVDVIVTLTALQPVNFHDDKEGMLGVRVASFLESPNEKSGTFYDASGKPTNVAGASKDATGSYRTSEGRTGDAAWGTRGRWCIDTGHTPDGKTETIAILDHPGNPGSPTYWHVRGYGLFAANPLGASIFDPTAAPMNFALKQGQAATFRYRVMILSSHVSDEIMNTQEAIFAKLYK